MLISTSIPNLPHPRTKSINIPLLLGNLITKILKISNFPPQAYNILFLLLAHFDYVGDMLPGAGDEVGFGAVGGMGSMGVGVVSVWGLVGEGMVDGVGVLLGS